MERSLWCDGAFAANAVALRPDFHLVARLEVIQELDGCFRGEVLKEVIVNLNHWCVHASTQTLHLQKCKETIRRRFCGNMRAIT